MWLVDGLADGGFAIVAKSHHALVDGISGLDLTTVLFDAEPDAPPRPAPHTTWTPRPLPTSAQLLSDALLERATRPRELVRSARAIVRTPRQLLREARDGLQTMGALAFAGLNPAPPMPLNVKTGPHRRYAWVDAELAELQGVKDALGGSVNDAVLAVVAGALGRFLRHRGVDTTRPRPQSARSGRSSCRRPAGRAAERGRADVGAAAARDRGSRRAVHRDPRRRRASSTRRVRRSARAR